MSHDSSRPVRLRLAALAAVFFAIAACCAVLPIPVRAATADTGWGPQGAIPTSSAATVRWDNRGNPAADMVDRGSYSAVPVAAQPIPHTLDPATGKPATYTDLATLPGSTAANNADVNAAAAFQNAQLNVSQTQSLAHQSVTVGLTGVVGNNFQNALGPSVVLMQCWGAAGDTQPDPSHCETGTSGAADTSMRFYTNDVISPQDRYLTDSGDYKIAASDMALLTGAMTPTGGGKATAQLVVQVPADATGTVEFDDAQGNVIQAGVPVTDGVASIQVPGQVVADDPTYTAIYHAAATSRYASAESGSLVLPAVRHFVGTPNVTSGDFSTLGNFAPAGTLAPFVFPAGTFTPGESVTLSLDAQDGTPQSLGTADAFGGLTADWTVPANLTGAHSVFINGFVGRQPGYEAGVAFTVAPLPAAGTASIADPTQVPFAAIDGTQIAAADAVSGGNIYYSVTSTNEQVDFEGATSATQTVSRTFEVDTGAQAPGLGCGARPDEPSTATCWLVAVPMGYAGDLGGLASQTSPLSPSQWAQRMQVQLSFAPVQTTCSGADAAVQSAGDETLAPAMASWIPSVCSADGIDLSYATLADQQARTDYANGAPGLVFSSAPVDADVGGGSGAPVYVPVGLTGLTIAVRAIDQRTRMPVTRLRLDARVIVKLLTESMAGAVDPFGDQAGGHQPVAAKVPWSTGGAGSSYVADQELQALNPGVELLPLYQSAVGGSEADIIVSSGQADGIDLLWQWLLADPDARAFLDGCPDPWGMTINPFYSTRTYAECPGQKAQLDAAAAAKIAVTAASYPPGYTYAPATYPPDGVTFPQPGYYQRDAAPATATVEAELPLTLADIHPQEGTLTEVGVDVSQGLEKSNTDPCFVDQESAAQCGSAPGQTMAWTNGATKGFFNNVLGLTDTATAAQYQLATAQLCSDYNNGSFSCVGAATASLQKAAAGFTTSGGVPVPTATPDIAGGAYPLTVPVYAEASTAVLGADGSHQVATVLSTITSSGQQPGFTQGSLPPGYAPLTPDLATLASAGIAKLKAVKGPKTPPQTSPGRRGATAPGTPETATAGQPPRSASPLQSPSAHASGSPGATGVAPPQQAQPAGLLVKTPATPSGFPQSGVAVGLAGAIACGGTSEVLRRRRKKGARK